MIVASVMGLLLQDIIQSVHLFFFSEHISFFGQHRGSTGYQINVMLVPARVVVGHRLNNNKFISLLLLSLCCRIIILQLPECQIIWL